MSENIKRYAFISYNHRDTKWAKWLQKKLESYKLPADIHNEFENSRYLRPVFRDKTDLNTGVLAHELRKELEESKYLIVICSPNSAKSTWVSEEVQAFIEMGRLDHIIPFIVAGTPHNYSGKDLINAHEDECFPLFLCQYTQQHPELELLGININEVGKEKAFVRVVSRMLGVNFDVLWKRHERQKFRSRISIVSACVLLVIALIFVWMYNLPFSSKITYVEMENNTNLPFVEGNIMIILDNDTLYESLNSIKEKTEFRNIPKKYHNKNVKFIFSAFGFNDLDTIIKLKSEILLPLKRKIETYGLIKGYVIDSEDKPIYNAQVSIMEYSTNTDKKGDFNITIPLAEQKPSDEGYFVTVRYRDSETEEKVYPETDNNIVNVIYLED